MFSYQVTSRKEWARSRSLHLDAHFGAHVLEHDSDGVNDFLIGAVFAIDDHPVLGLLPD
jgi:hypothetical protein